MERRAWMPLVGALGCLAGFVLVGLVALSSPHGQWVDSNVLLGFVDLSRPRLVPAAQAVGSLADPGSFVLLGAVLSGVALVRRRPRTALAVPLILLAAAATSQVLKPALAQPRLSAWLGADQIAAASWPSGHATGAMALALCAVLVASPRLRPVIATIGAGFAVAVGYAIMTLSWHYPSDVLGGYLVAATWTLLGIGLLRAADSRWPAHTGRAAAMRLRTALAPPVIAAVGAAGVAAAVFVARPLAVLDYAQAHTMFVGGAAALACVGTALVVGLSLALRR